MQSQGETTTLPAVDQHPPVKHLRTYHKPESSLDPALAVTIITPDRGWFDWRLRQLWRYRDLISLFVWRDFVSVYKQTILGPAWHIIRPLMTTLIFTVVFSRMAGLSTDGAPPFLFYMVGNVAWAYFASCLDNTSKTFVANAALLGKVYFHRLVIPVSLVILESDRVRHPVRHPAGRRWLVYAIAGRAPPPDTSWVLLTPLLLAAFWPATHWAAASSSAR